MRCNLADTVWKIIDKEILSKREVELFYFFFVSKYAIEYDLSYFHKLNMGSRWMTFERPLHKFFHS